jgi:hypothetical protein
MRDTKAVYRAVVTLEEGHHPLFCQCARKGIRFSGGETLFFVGKRIAQHLTQGVKILRRLSGM